MEHTMKNEQLTLLLLILAITIATTACSSEDQPSNKLKSPAATGEPNIEREKRMAEQTSEMILDGKPVLLDIESGYFLSIYTEAKGRTKGGVILLHGRGFHPDWADTINPLRVGLAEDGWTTLSLQMPVLEQDATYYDYVPIFPYAFPRIEAGINHLKSQGIKNIVLLAHSCSVHMSMAWIKQTGGSGISAYIGIGMGATDDKQPMISPFPIEKISVPILDVYAENDFPAVIKMASLRQKQITRAGNKKSAQEIIPEADHFYTGKGGNLLKVVSNWLDTLKKR